MKIDKLKIDVQPWVELADITEEDMSTKSNTSGEEILNILVNEVLARNSKKDQLILFILDENADVKNVEKLNVLIKDTTEVDIAKCYRVGKRSDRPRPEVVKISKRLMIMQIEAINKKKDKL